MGAGRVGAVIAADLAIEANLAVTLADSRPKLVAGHAGVTAITEDLSSAETIKKLATEHDIVVGALPSALGWNALQAVIEAGRNYCDISFMPENALELNDLARDNGVTAVVDCGIAPGLTHMLAGHAAGQLDEVERATILVGGVPQARHWPFQYKAGFAPLDVIEEYTRPVRLVENHRVVEREALSDLELVDFPGVGTLEAFNTDGLRSLLHTVSARYMSEKTLRYPGHAELVKVLRHIGLFGKTPITVGDATVRPIDVTAQLLFPKWRFAPGETDITLMRVDVQGTAAGAPARYLWTLIDRADPVTGWTSMSRTTGFPCSIVTRMLAEARLDRPGVLTPEMAVQTDGVLDTVLQGLQHRGIAVASGH